MNSSALCNLARRTSLSRRRGTPRLDRRRRSLVLSVGFVVLALAAPLAAQSPRFVSSELVPNFWTAFPGVPGGPVTGAFGTSYGYAPIQVADINSDGHLDLLTACESPVGAVIAIFGDGTGEFSNLTVLPSYASPVSVSAADFNEDGRPDIVVCNGDAGTVTIMLSSPTNWTFVTIPTGSRPVRAYSADLTENGHLDLVVVDEIDSTVGLLPGNGNGTFGPLQISFVEVDDSLEALTIEDVNNDGRLDLVIPCPVLDMVAVLISTGNGAFLPPAVYTVESNPGPLAVDDFDGDGKFDVLVPNRDANSISILRGVGDGSFLPAQSITSPDSPVCVRSIRNAFSDTFGTYPHLNASQFSVVDSLDAVGTPSSQTIQSTHPVDWIESADFNGDGLGDLAVVSRDEGTVEVFLQQPGEFIRGDLNGDESVTIADFIRFLDALVGAKEIDCIDRADVNDDGAIDLQDPVRLLRRLYLGGSPLPAPTFGCGLDTTPDTLPACFPDGSCSD